MRGSVDGDRVFHAEAERMLFSRGPKVRLVLGCGLVQLGQVVGTLLSLVAGIIQTSMLRKRNISSLPLRANMLGLLIF
jgi:hypothetical protein